MRSKARSAGTHGTMLNTASMLAGQFFGKGTFLLSLMILSRYLDDNHFGMLVFAVALGQILLFLADLGVSVISTKKFSLDPDRIQEIYSTALGLRLLTTFGAWSLIVLGSVIAGYETDQIIMIVLIGLASAMETGAELQFSVFRAKERMIYEAVTRATGGIVSLVLVLAVVVFNRGPIAASAVYALRTTFMLILSMIFLSRFHVRILPRFRVKRILDLLRESWAFGVGGIILIMIYKLDNVIIRELAGIRAVGAYQEIIRILEASVLLITPTLLPGALFPGLCRAFQTGWKETRERMISIAQLVTGIAGAVVIPVLAGGVDLLRLLWGDSFLRGLDAGEVESTFLILMIALPAVFWTNFLMSGVVAYGKQKDLVPIAMIALVVNITGNIVLVPLIGITGAAVMVLITHLFGIVLLYYVLRKGGPLPLVIGLWKPVVAAGISVTVFFLIRNGSVPLRIIIPTAVYLVIWISLGGLRLLLTKQKIIKS